MPLLRDLIPTNLQQEKRKFFFDTSYNPQFTYVREFHQQEWDKYGLPKKTYFDHALKMIEDYGVPQPVQPPFCTPEEVEREVTELFARLELPVLPVKFSNKFPSQVSITAKELRFRTPMKYGLESLRNKLNHEIQTHYLRKHNQQLQTWDLGSEKVRPRNFRLTEEGLANLHSHVGRDDGILRKTYLNYFAAYQAQNSSFSELFHQLLGFGLSEKFAWNLTFKQKRGLTDTSQPGGFSKNNLFRLGAGSVGWRT